MLAAFQELRASVQDVEMGSDVSKRTAALSRWLDHLERNVIVVVVEAASTSDAFQIFETLNDRGAPLTIADLLKNYLMSLEPSRVGDIQTAWDIAVGNLGAEVETQDFVTFIRHFWNSLHGATRERDLYGSLRRRIDTPEAAIEFVDSLAAASEPYAAMLDPSHDRWASSGSLIPQGLETLSIFQLGQYRPLLLSAIERFHEEEVARLTEALVCWSFRGVIVGGIGGGTMERAYSTAAINVRSGEARSTEDVFALLRPQIPADEEFRNAFEQAALHRVRISHYVLRAIERALQNVDHPSLEPYPAVRDAPIATHVLPRKASAEDWPRFAVDDMPQYVNRIGNLALRPPDRMTPPVELGSRVAWVVEFGFLVNSDLPKYIDWTPDAIRHRQQDMASVAAELWPRTPR